MRYPNRWVVGEWTFYEIEDHGFKDELEGVSLFGYARNERSDVSASRQMGEFYVSLEHAMAAAIAEKHTGRRGAGGTGVGTAADWFMAMIGADRPTRQELIDKAAKDQKVIEVAEDAGAPGDAAGVAGAVIDALGLGRKS